MPGTRPGKAVQDVVGLGVNRIGMTLDTYLADEKTRFAVMRGYEIMGEAVRHLPQELKLANPEIRWATMTAVRNRITHGYFGINDSILFATIHEELIALLPRLEALAARHAEGD